MALSMNVTGEQCFGISAQDRNDGFGARGGVMKFLAAGFVADEAAEDLAGGADR